MINSESKKRIENLIQIGIDEGAKPLKDGRNCEVSGLQRKFYCAYHTGKSFIGWNDYTN